MKVATLQSQDIVSRRDISAAYRYFNIPLSEAKNIEDHRILELFQAQQPDLGPAAQEGSRAHLYKIGVSRQSSLLLNASRESVDTYEDALAWLGNGVTKDTADEGILAVLAIRVSRSCYAGILRCWATRADIDFRPETARQTRKSERKQSP